MSKTVLFNSCIAIFVTVFSISQPVCAFEVNSSTDIDATTVALSHEDQLKRREVELQELLAAKTLSKDEKKAMSNELKAIQKELKEIDKQRDKQAKARAKADKARLAQLKKQYGDGPYPDEIAAFVENKPEELKPFLSSLYIEGERNAVLNFDRLGVAAFQLGHDDFAQWALDNSLDRIESIYADDEAARLAKSKFAKEKVKDFKGEPYERAMAYYYRGLLYLKQGDYQNARASFKSAEFQDTMSDLEEFKADFAVLNFLSGWASQCDGDQSLANEYYEQALAFNPNLEIPQLTDNVLLIAETGLPPVKVTEGEHDEILKFYPNPNYGEDSVHFVITDENSATVWDGDCVAASSVLRQATTRGGRPIDGLLEGKAAYKEGVDLAGDMMAAGGLAAMQIGSSNNNDNMVGAGAVLAIGGFLAKAISDAMKPEADSRYWDNLPDKVNVKTLRHENIDDAIVIAEYQGAEGDIPAANQAAIAVDPGVCSLVWARARSALAVAESAPNARLSSTENKKQKKELKAKEENFRRWLTENTPGETT